MKCFSNDDVSTIALTGYQSFRHATDSRLSLTEITNQPIPKKNRKHDDDMVSPRETKLINKEGASTAAYIDYNERIANIQSIHENSDAKPYGEAYIFIDRGDCNLGWMILKKRCIGSKDCILGSTYIDNTNFSNALKSDECPMIAYSSNNGKSWYRGYLINPGPGRVEILRVHGKDVFHDKISQFFPMGKHRGLLSIRYINEVNETMDSKCDGALVSNTTGPDMIHIESLPQHARELKFHGLENIIQIKPRVNLVERTATNPFTEGTGHRKMRRSAHMVTKIHFVQNAGGNEMKKDDRKGLFAFMSPDKMGTLYFLDPDIAKTIVNEGEWSRKDFLKIIQENSKFSIDCTMLKVPEDGLALAERCEREDSNEKKIPTGIEVFKLPYDIFAQYSVQDELDVDLKKFSFVVDAVTNGVSFRRTCTKSLGLSVIKKVNNSERPIPTPRKDRDSLKKSECWNDKMNATFAPLFYFLIEMLARYSSKMSSALDLVTDKAYRQIYVDNAGSDENRFEIESNTDPSMGLFGLQILTFPNGSNVNFANTEHVDKNDGNDDIFNKTMEQKIEQYLGLWLKRLSSAKLQIERNQCMKNIKAILHLIRRGSRGGDNTQLKFSTDTTCAYQVFYTGEKKRDVLVTFAYPSNKVVVEFEIGKLIFQKWASFDTSHMTPVALSFDSQNVYLRDEHLVVLAWGGGGTKKITNFLSVHNLPNEGTRFTIRRMCEVMRENAASDEVVNAAAAAFPRHQTFITQFFAGYNAV